jgi:predicted small secreted protein
MREEFRLLQQPWQGTFARCWRSSFDGTAALSAVGREPFVLNRRRTMTRNIRALLLAVLSIGALALAACNTTAGVGRDVRSAGNAIEDTANDARH